MYETSIVTSITEKTSNLLLIQPKSFLVYTLIFYCNCWDVFSWKSNKYAHVIF